MYLNDLHNAAAGGLGIGARNPRREKDGKSWSGGAESERRPGVCGRAEAGARDEGPAWLEAALRTLEQRLRRRGRDEQAGAMAARGPGSCAGPARLA